MVAGTEKTLWVVHYASLTSFLDKAAAVGSTGVAIRSDNDLKAAITAGHNRGLKVFGWRWPAVLHDSAMAEANQIASLLAQGLDGYFVDPEPNQKSSLNWDQDGLEPIADAFCGAIVAAGPGKPFGLTSHYLAKRVAPKLPWATFFKYATILLPQAYWRSTEGIIGHGPSENYAAAITAWAQAGGKKELIAPMAGELGVAQPAEIAAHAAAAQKARINTLHFFDHGAAVTDAVWQAVQAA